MTRRLGVGIVGAGRVAELHVAAIRAVGGSLVGVASSTAARAVEARDRWGAARAFDSVDALVADREVDVVHITSPSALHAGQVEMALRAGKHVVCEKPLAIAAEQAAHLIALSDDAGLIGTVAYTYRFHPIAREARSRAALIGPLVDMHGSYRQDWMLGASPDEWRLDPARNGPSRSLADIGSHLIDLAEFISHDRVASVAAATRSVIATGDTGMANSDDAVSIAITMRSGAIGTLSVSQVAIGHQNSLTLEFSGANGSVALDQRTPQSLWLADADGVQDVALSTSTLGAEARRMGFNPSGRASDYGDAFGAFIRDSYAAIDGEEVEGLPTFRDCSRALSVRAAVLDSAHSGRWVDVPRTT